jgi:hypothetical protein
MGIGEILDRALTIYRQGFRLFFPVMLVFQTAMLTLMQAFQYVAQEKSPVLSRPGAFKGVLPPADQFLWLGASAAVVLPLYLAVHQLGAAAIIAAAHRRLLDEPSTLGASIRAALGRAHRLTGTLLLAFAWTFFLVGLAAVPGVACIAGAAFVESPAARVALILAGVLILMLFTVVVGLWLLLRYALLAQVVMLEDRSFLSAMTRSASLMAGRVGTTLFDNCKVRVSLIYAVNFFLALSVLIVLLIPTSIVNAIYGVSPFDPQSYDPARVPLYARLPLQIFQTVGQAAVAPFAVLAMVVFYLDVRIKREGYDLEVRAALLERAR